MQTGSENTSQKKRLELGKDDQLRHRWTEPELFGGRPR